jgi:hypothetical protein
VSAVRPNFFNKPFELCRRSDLQPTTWTLRAHNERVWHTTRQQDEGTRAGLPPILAAHLFALPDSRPGWDDREVDGFRLQWL